jgi:hypothetical protein
MLRPPDAGAALQQGDMIRDVPFFVFRKVINVKVQGTPGQTRIDCQHLKSFEKAREISGGKALTATEVPLVLQPGMVVTQSCDLDYKDQITLARVFPIGQLVQEAKDALEHQEPLVLYDVIRRLTEGSNFSHLVYVGDPDGTGPQAADLLRVQSFPRDWKDCFHQQRLKMLTDEGLKYLQGRLATFTGRYATVEGFWHTAEYLEIAEQLKKDRNALRQAYDRLNEKKAKPTGK